MKSHLTSNFLPRLTRTKDKEEWKPLCKADCQKLNENNPENGPILIDYGRATANPELGLIHHHFYPKPDQKLISATWFLKTEDPKDKSRYILEPITDVPTTIAIEELYQQAAHAASSMGSGMDEMLKEQVPISENHHVAVERSTDGHYVFRKIPNGTWFRGKSTDLQRGYGSYTLPGEAEEAILGPVDHVIFVIHGIGEAMWSREDVTYTGSLVQDITSFRHVMQKRQVEECKIACGRARKQKYVERGIRYKHVGSTAHRLLSPDIVLNPFSLPEPAPPNRVELIPILWYDRVHSSSSALMKSLQAATLKTIPALREIANDVIFDVLMYLTPNFCYDVLECVTEQIIQMLALFQKHHPEFVSNGGKCSLMGHSLGSVICWDLLSILHEEQQSKQGTESPKKEGEHWVHIADGGHSSEIGYQSYASQEGADQAKNGNIGPSLPRPMKHVLPFEPQHTIFLGSPIGLFLTLRGAHPVFDALRDNLPPGPGRPRASPFRLPSKGIHNIFHPSDPVAYRIEPLLLVQGTPDAELPAPEYLTKEGEGVRLHVKAKQFGDQIRKSIFDKKPTFSSFMNVVSDQAQTLLHQMDERSKTEAEPAALKSESETDKPTMIRFPLAGRTGRIDFQLQPNVIDSEYVSAVLAHSSYFSNSDVIDYTIDLTRSKSSEVIDLTIDDAMAIDS